MLIERTLFNGQGKPLGIAQQDSMSCKVQFIPHGANKPLPTFWLSIEACREAVLADKS